MASPPLYACASMFFFLWIKNGSASECGTLVYTKKKLRLINFLPFVEKITLGPSFSQWDYIVFVFLFIFTNFENQNFDRIYILGSIANLYQNSTLSLKISSFYEQKKKTEHLGFFKFCCFFCFVINIQILCYFFIVPKNKKKHQRTVIYQSRAIAVPTIFDCTNDSRIWQLSSIFWRWNVQL
jgi:hypothetical protein